MRFLPHPLIRVALLLAVLILCVTELAIAGQNPPPTQAEQQAADSMVRGLIGTVDHDAHVIAADSGRALLSGAVQVEYLRTRTP